MQEKSVCNNIQLERKKLIQLLFMCSLSFISGINSAIDLIISLSVCFILLVNLNNEEFLFFYPVLMIYEAQFLLPFGIGSVTRVYFGLIIIKILMSKNKTLKVKVRYLIFAIPILFLEFWRITYGIYSFSILMNIFMLIYIHTKILNNSRMLGKELLYLGIAIFGTGFYGIIKGNFLNAALLSGSSYYHYSRLSGTINDPNYSSMFFNLGIFSIIFCGVQIGKTMKTIIISGLYIFLLMTVSIQGITGNLLFLMVAFLVINKKKMKLKHYAFLLIGIIMLISLFISNVAIIQPYQHRIDNIISGDRDLNEVTSGRTALRSNYTSIFNEKPFSGKLLGGTLVISDRSTRREHINLTGGVSHDAYIDMLFEIGILGAIWVVLSFLYGIIVYFRLYKKTKTNAYLGIVFLKIIMLYTSFGISVFPFRYFLYVYFF